MSRLDELPPDQRAALSLLLGQRKSYAEVATLLAIQERAVHDRAHAALALLAPRQARELTAERREEIGDYLLGQQPGVGDRLATRAYLSESEPARDWATALAGELAPLSSAALPEIPDPSAPAPADHRPRSSGGSSAWTRAADAVAARTPGSFGERLPAARLGQQMPTSRRGGALLLALIAAAVIVVVILVTSGGGGSHAAKSAATRSTAAKTTSGPAVTQKLTLTSPTPGSKTVGVMDILAEGSRRAFFIDAENLPESKGFFYALWLYNSPTSHRPLSASPPVGSNHRLQGGALLPSDAATYHTVLVTRETSKTPAQPGPVVLSGAFSLGA
jgi:Sigma-70, region 4